MKFIQIITLYPKMPPLRKYPASKEKNIQRYHFIYPTVQ